jgi:hypothetical protein
MEMGKLTAKLRDAVPVCLLVEGKEIKRYKNIEIPDDLKKLEYQDFKFDVPLNGAITFKIMFEPGILPEEFPQARERKTRQPAPQGAEPQAMAAEAETEAEVAEEAAPQDGQPAEALPAETMEALAQALEDAQTAGEPVADIAAAMADGETIKTEIIEDEATGRVLVITAEPESAEATAQPESDVPAKKPAPKGKGKKGAAPADSADK